MLPPVIALVIVSLLPMSSLADERKIPHLHVDNPFYIPNPVTGSHAIYTIPLAANMHKAALEAVTLPSELEPLDLRKELNFVTELKKKGPPHAGKRSPSHGDSKQTSTSSHPIPAVSTAFLLRRVKATTVFYRGITILVRGLVLRNAGNWQLFPRRDIELWLANSAFNHVGRIRPDQVQRLPTAQLETLDRLQRTVVYDAIPRQEINGMADQLDENDALSDELNQLRKAMNNGVDIIGASLVLERVAAPDVHG